MFIRIAFAFLLALVGAAHAAGNGLGQIHSFKDWEIGCDNTRRCEAQGYGSESEERPPGGRAALIVQREAGPNRLPKLTLAFSFFDDAAVQLPLGQPIRLQAGALRLRLPAVDKNSDMVQVPAPDVPALLAAVLRAEHILLSAGAARWSVSLAGASAALLKMDDLQGRVGTTGALVRRGPRAEPTDAPPLPTVAALRLPPTTDADRRLAPMIAQALPRSADDCPDFDPQEELLVAPVRVSAGELLVSQACWRGAYQTGSRLWRVSDRPPFRTTAVKLPQPDGSLGDTAVIDVMMNDGGTLSVHEAAKGRGIGDCWAARDWTWTERGLALVEASESPCRLFEAGGLSITLWRAQAR